MSVVDGVGQGFESSARSLRIQVLLLVIALHLAIGYALLSGTAREQVAPVNQPLQAVIIQEVTITPAFAPAPSHLLIEKPSIPKQRAAVVTPPPPKTRQPVTPVQIAPDATLPASPQAPAPPPSANVKPPLTPTTPSMSATPHAPSVPSSPVTSPSVAAAKPDIHIACPKQIAPTMPRQALRDGTQGVVKAQAVIRDGVVREVAVLSGPSVFHAAVRRAMLQYECTPSPTEIVVTQDFNFKFE